MNEFYLSDSQKEKLNDWKSKIKDLFGCYGGYDYIFTPCGIGMQIKVRSHLIKKEIDLTEFEKW